MSREDSMLTADELRFLRLKRRRRLLVLAIVLVLLPVGYGAATSYTISNNTVGSATTAGGGPLVVNIAGTMNMSGGVSGTSGHIKDGIASLTLSSTGTYTGATLVSAGTLNAGAANALGGTPSITVNSGGTLLLSNSGTNNRINDNATMTLNGGTFNTGGMSEHNLSGTTITPGIGALTLQSSSIIDLANGASILAFAASNGQTWSGTLVTGGGTDQLFVGTDTSGLTQTQLNMISFYSGTGTGFLGTGAGRHPTTANSSQCPSRAPGPRVP